MQRNAGDASADAAAVRECARHVRMVGGNTAPICSDLSIFVGMAGNPGVHAICKPPARHRARIRDRSPGQITDSKKFHSSLDQRHSGIKHKINTNIVPNRNWNRYHVDSIYNHPAIRLNYSRPEFNPRAALIFITFQAI
ncbi:hypothetical protein [Burkholderia lata]|uniref:hypothetical protein n=1 Tax=Burkholderia lata (strain ATCC 17760 / DSM 23089 / LMG 22485 / NCIMB 9086 / R18194 / 383) TaxID=482957 RepID=UPI0015832930|nr:hypothetical protein [Burkholderia lata]